VAKRQSELGDGRAGWPKRQLELGDRLEKHKPRFVLIPSTFHLLYIQICPESRNQSVSLV
jgi:hypothetical protein